MKFLSGGHGKDPGAVASNGKTERSYIVEVCRRVLELAKENGKEVLEVGINTNATIAKKTKYINDICKKEKLDSTNSNLIEIHFDWKGSKSGIGAYHYTGSDQSKAYAQKILEAVKKETGLSINYNKGDTTSRFGKLGIIRDTIPLAVLIECGSLGNDIEFLENGGIEKLAIGIYSGIFGEKPKEKELPKKEALSVADTLKIKRVTTILSDVWHRSPSEIKELLHEANNTLKKIFTHV